MAGASDRFSTLAALSTFYPGARNVKDHAEQELQVLRLVGKIPTIAAYAYRHSLGLPYVYPDNTLGYTQFAAASPDGRRSATLSVTEQLPGKPAILKKFRRAAGLAVCAALARG